MARLPASFMSQPTHFVRSCCCLRSSELFESDSSFSFTCLSIRSSTGHMARNRSPAIHCSSRTGPSNRISPVLESMMMSSGWGIGSGPVAPLRARSAGSHTPGNNTAETGAGGFEPPHDGIKIRCLTAWRRPNSALFQAAAHGRRTIMRGGASRNRSFRTKACALYASLSGRCRGRASANRRARP
jgi:hypothetical protein